MTWRVTREDIELFRRELWKDERTFPSAHAVGSFIKDCFTSESASREFTILAFLSSLKGEPLCPRPIAREGSHLEMEAADGMRLFEVLRALRELEQRYRDGRANLARTILLARQRQRLARIQEAFVQHSVVISPEPYPLHEKLESLLILLARVLDVRFDDRARENLDSFATFWENACCQIPFRDATPKNTILMCAGLNRASRPSGGEGDVECVDRLLRTSDSADWEALPLIDLDFSSAEHLTTFEDDPISLHFHEWTFGSCPLEPTSLLLLPTVAMANPYRTAASFLVRYLRFGGRKLAYRLLNSQGFEIRFRYDDPLFYFQRLSEFLPRLSPEFCGDFADLLSFVESIGYAAGSLHPADRQLLRVDHFRAIYGHGGNYWPENPGELKGGV